MKKFSFSLQRMLAYKQSLYEKERNELARLRAERQQVQARRDETQRQILARDQEFHQKAATEGISVEEVNQIGYLRTTAEYFIRQMDEEMQKLDILIAKQLRIVIELDRDVKGLEKLREKQWEEYQAAAAIEERERILELVSTKYLETQAENAAEEAAEIARAVS